MNLPKLNKAKFWNCVDRRGPDDCWEWTGRKSTKGYGLFGSGRWGWPTNRAHRISFGLASGELPDRETVIRHKCDNPGCVNPNHLEPGTPADNIRDMHERGRAKKRDSRGEANPMAKLTADQVIVIQRRIKNGETNVAIARDFPVTHQMISKIRLGRFWKEVDSRAQPPPTRLPYSSAKLRLAAKLRIGQAIDPLRKRDGDPCRSRTCDIRLRRPNGVLP